MPVEREQPRAGAIAAGHHPILLVLDFLNPLPLRSGAYAIRAFAFGITAKVASAPLGCAILWFLPPLPNFAWLMAQPEGQTGEPLSYQFQFLTDLEVSLAS